MLKINNLNFKRDKSYCFNLNVKQGEMICLYGDSGIGKSTLLSLIAGFETADSGSIEFNGGHLNQLSINQRPISMLFQEDNLFPHFTTWQNIAIGIKQNLKLNEAQNQAIHKIIEKLAITDQLQKKPDQMSGGQVQRVAIARCLLRDNPILLLDEPFSALDKEKRLDCLQLIRELQQEKKWTVILVSHHPDEAKQYVDRIVDCQSILTI
ncbi:MAG: ATP-binding cassette domain-containing protein [Saccharospirillaceae bacterium]|nr:ATP-binding cassette domain-containing protein [Pseudomonadales bacterium]NRB80790.1 ATP-binding cassette domain-containing protein [Saccharospirillaceae bacterium]